MKRFRSYPAMFFIIGLTVSLLNPLSAFARTPLAPQTILEKSDVIIIADVVRQQEQSDVLLTSLYIVAKIKDRLQELDDPTLAIFQTKAAGQVMPLIPEDGRLLVMLQRTEKGYTLTSQLYSFATLQGTQIVSVAGEAESSPQKYLKYYQSYLEKTLKEPLPEAGSFIGWGPWTFVLLAILMVLIFANLYFLLKRGKGHA
jgi:hypothetical protein